MTKITAQQLYIELKDNFKIQQQQIGSIEMTFPKQPKQIEKYAFQNQK